MMAKMGTVKVNINSILSKMVRDMEITVNVTGLKTFNIRLKIATLFFRIGVFILNCRLKIDKGGK